MVSVAQMERYKEAEEKIRTTWPFVQYEVMLQRHGGPAWDILCRAVAALVDAGMPDQPADLRLEYAAKIGAACMAGLMMQADVHTIISGVRKKMFDN